MNRSRMIRRTRLFGATVLALGLYACSDQANQPLAPDAAELAFASPLSQSALAVAISAQESVLPQLMALEDVVGRVSAGGQTGARRSRSS